MNTLVLETLLELKQGGGDLWIPIAIMVGMAVVLVPLVLWGIKRGRIAEEERVRVWTALAQQRGLKWVGSGGPWYRRTAPRIEGVLDSAPVVLDTYVVSTGKSAITYTRTKAQLPGAGSLSLVAARRGFWNGLGEKLGRASLRSGDSSFDDAVFVRASDEALAWKALDRDTRRELARFPKCFRLMVKNAEASLSWQGLERERPVLDAALAIVSSMARGLRG